MTRYHRAIIFYNDKAGQSIPSEQINLIEGHFRNHSIPHEIIKVPCSTDEMAAITLQAQSDGVDLFVAAGGDGTVAMVGTPLIGTDIALGLLPIGTGNLLARELKIPLTFEPALKLITSPAANTTCIDAIRLEDQCFILNVSAGITARVMARVNSDEKKRLGVFAYIFRFIQQLLGLKLQKFEIECDGHRRTVSAAEVLVANSRLVGLEPLQWPEPVSLTDGYLDLFIIRTANLLDILSFVFTVFSRQNPINPVIKYMRFSDYCKITAREELPVQADGDVVSQTPINLTIEKASLKIITPASNSVQ